MGGVVLDRASTHVSQPETSDEVVEPETAEVADAATTDDEAVAPEDDASDAAEADADSDAAVAAVAGDPDAERPLDVRAVLDEIGAEETIAHLEARVAGLEQDLERADTRAREGERSRQGELDLMRARVEDAMTLVRETLDEQRTAWTSFEERFSGLVRDAEENSRSFVSELRDELTPRVQKAVMQTESSAAELKGEISTIAEDLDGRATELTGTLAELRRSLDRSASELSTQLSREQEERAAAATALEDRLRSRLDELATADEERHGEALTKVEALRRELDAAVGELRAGLNLRANELTETLSDLHDELTEAIDARQQAEAALERRWIDGTREIARRIEQNESVLRDSVQAERGQRQEADDELGQRVERIGTQLSELATKLDGELGRQGTSVEQLRRQGEEVATRLDVLQGKVAEAVSQIASQLTNRVATVVGDLAALRDTSVSHQEKLASLDHLSRKVDELAKREPAAAVAPAVDDERLDRIEKELAGLRQHVSSMGATVTATAQQARDLHAAISSLSSQGREQEGMRQEVRELAARTSEMTHRIDETEKLARAAGQAIASAVRRARTANAKTSGSDPVEHLGERPIFSSRPPTPPPGAPPVSAEDLDALERIEREHE